MGNQQNKIGKNFSFVQCKIEELDYSVQREVQNEFYYNSSNKQIRMKSTKGIKNLSHKKPNFPFKIQNQIKKEQQQQNLKQNQPVGNYERIINAQNKKLKLLNKSNPNIIHQQMEWAYKFMKSLNVLEKFEQKYNKEYPMLILNKDPSIKKLRHQILKEKQSHHYFHLQMKNQRHPQREEYTWNNKEGNQQIQKRKKNEEQIYNNFVILERIEWVLIRLFQTGRHCTVLKHLKDLDMDYQLNYCEDRVQKVGQCLQMINRFVKEVDGLDIELMDMLFYQLNQTQCESSQEYQFETQHFSNQVIPSFNQNLINVKELIMKNKQTNKITNKNTHQGNKQQNQEQQQQQNEYESCKELGWQIYKQNKVCFYILAVGNQTFSPQLQPLNIPFNLTIIQILLQKYDAFAQLLQLNQMNVNILIDTKRTHQLNSIIQKNDNKWQRLNIRILKTQQLPILDLEGNFIINKRNTQKIHDNKIQKLNQKGIQTINQQHNKTLNQKSIRMGSIGSVDVWNCIEEDLNQLQQFQYVQVIETRNCLQMGFDCFLLGKMVKQNLQFATKLFQPLQRLTELTLINSNKSLINSNKSLINSNKSLINSQSNKLSKSPLINDLPQLNQPIFSFSPYPFLVYPSQTHYDQYLQHIKQKSYPYYVYGGHSLISVSFAKKLLNKTKNKQKSKFRKKTFLQNNQKFLTFQRDFLDLPIQSIINSNNKEESKINLNQEDSIKWMMFLYQRDNSYYPMNFQQNQGIFDIQGSSKTLNMDSLFKLDLSFNKFISKDWMKKIKCYIDPHVSLEGQGLQQIKLEIERRINEILTERKLFQYEGKLKVPLLKGERKQYQKVERSQQTQSYKFQQDLSGYQRLKESGIERKESGIERKESGIERKESGIERKESGIERKESVIERIEEQISNSQMVPSNIISSISQVIVLQSSNGKTQKQISIFID